MQTLERCNRDNLRALEEIVGVRSTVRVRVSYQVHEKPSATEMVLRAAGDEWSEHILEGVKVCPLLGVNLVDAEMTHPD